jgi:SlyX protein
MDQDNRIVALEEQLAHLLKAYDDMSGIVASHEKKIEKLERTVRLLAEREAERQAEGAEVIADQPPPHW